MNDDLPALPQPVREAVEICDRDLSFYAESPSDHWSEPSAWYKVRTELLRLTDENVRLLKANRDAMDHFEQMQAKLAKASRKKNRAD
jgi:hypothetical protein